MPKILVSAKKLPDNQLLFSFSHLDGLYKQDIHIVSKQEEKREKEGDTSWMVKGDAAVHIKLIWRDKDPMYCVGGREAVEAVQSLYDEDGISSFWQPRVESLAQLVREEYWPQVKEMVPNQTYLNSDELLTLARGIRSLGTSGVIRFNF